MAQVLIRNIEDEVIEQYRTKAELSGRSLEQELRDGLRQSAPLSHEQKIEMSRRSGHDPERGEADAFRRHNP